MRTFIRHISLKQSKEEAKEKNRNKQRIKNANNKIIKTRNSLIKEAETKISEELYDINKEISSNEIWNKNKEDKNINEFINEIINNLVNVYKTRFEFRLILKFDNKCFVF